MMITEQQLFTYFRLDLNITKKTKCNHNNLVPSSSDQSLTWRCLRCQRESSRQAVALHLICGGNGGVPHPRLHVTAAGSVAGADVNGGLRLPLFLQLLLPLLRRSDLLLYHRQSPLLLGAQAEWAARRLGLSGSGCRCRAAQLRRL